MLFRSFVLAEKVAGMIYNAPGAAPAIQTMSMAIFLLGIHQVSTGILQGMGKTTIPVINMIIAASVKVSLNWTLTALPWMGIKGAAWATVADIGIAALLNLVFIYRHTGFSLPIIGVVKTMVAATAMGIAVHLFLLATSTWGVWNILGGIIIAVPVYGVVLTLIGGLQRQDLEEVPILGHKILALGNRFGLFK